MSRAGEIQVHCEVIQHAEDSSANVLNVSVVDERSEFGRRFLVSVEQVKRPKISELSPKYFVLDSPSPSPQYVNPGP